MLILASASPRRQELLQQLGWAFRVVKSEAEEVSDPAMEPERLVLENAGRKAREVAARVGRQEFVLGADTVVSIQGRIFGKPADAGDAKRMLRCLSGQVHMVSTGVALAHGGEVWQAAAHTMVAFAELSDAEIARYVATGEPLDKAGAYAIQGRAAAFVTRIEGSYSNVVGLPLHLLTVLAGKAGIDIYGSDGQGSARG